ncbi:uncharacterized protein BP5553_09041 [Venustampulla echinocandica]|uniref:Bacteriophage T5 Orf172 DNA-binding domain-containing protein n=1 Tax=Venustampulla echinocandica TaxID=2656787 RepID=A0A370TDP1_9HELO|nr:uncharacterized protein BP5553_09041 [Venustampulla echinocandica]RDL32585.1 hypothetical protein BP5553_09041 [Venustampulla echinocandica]
METPIRPSPDSVASGSSLSSAFSDLSIFDNDSISPATPATPAMSNPGYFPSSKKTNNNSIYKLPSQKQSMAWRQTGGLYGKSASSPPTRMAQSRVSSAQAIYQNTGEQSLDDPMEDITAKLGTLTLGDNLGLSKELANSPSFKKSRKVMLRTGQVKPTLSPPIIAIDEDEHQSTHVSTSQPALSLDVTTEDGVGAKAREVQDSNTLSPDDTGHLQKVPAPPRLEGSSTARTGLHGLGFQKVLPATSIDPMGSAIKMAAESGANGDNVPSTKLLPSIEGIPENLASEEPKPQEPTPVNTTLVSPNEEPTARTPEQDLEQALEKEFPDFEPFNKIKTTGNGIKLKILEVVLNREDRRKKAKNTASPSSDSSSNPTGYIYVFTSPSTPKYMKIGKTLLDPDKRRCQWARQCKFTATRIDDPNGKKFTYYSMVERLVQLELANERRKFKCGKCKRRHIFDQRKEGGGRSEVTEHGEWYEVTPERALAVVGRWRAWATKEPYANDGTLNNVWKWKYDQAMKCVEMDWDKWARGQIRRRIPAWVRTRWLKDDDDQNVLVDWDRWVQITWGDHLSFSLYCFDAEMRIFWPKFY